MASTSEMEDSIEGWVLETAPPFEPVREVFPGPRTRALSATQAPGLAQLPQFKRDLRNFRVTRVAKYPGLR